MIFNSKTSNRKFSCPCICCNCQVHVFETEYPNTLLNTMIKYKMNKHSGPLLQKSNFSSPGRINFSNFFIIPPKTFQLSLGVAGKRNTDFVSFVTILPIFAAKRPEYNSIFIKEKPVMTSNHRFIVLTRGIIIARINFFERLTNQSGVRIFAEFERQKGLSTTLATRNF